MIKKIAIYGIGLILFVILGIGLIINQGATITGRSSENQGEEIGGGGMIAPKITPTKGETSTSTTPTTTLKENEEQERTSQEITQKKALEEQTGTIETQEKKEMANEIKTRKKLQLIGIIILTTMILITITITARRTKNKGTGMSKEQQNKLQDYIKEAKQAGMSKEEIEKSLIENGWEKETIKDILKTIK